MYKIIPDASKEQMMKQKLFMNGIKSQIVEESLIDIDDLSSCKKNAEKYGISESKASYIESVINEYNRRISL